MRFLLTLAALTLLSAQPAFATSVCPVQHVQVAFEPNSATLTSEGREALETSYLRARQCEAPVFTIMTSGNDVLGRDRGQLVRTELIALGLSAATPIHIAIDEPSADDRPAPDHVMMFVDYDH